MSATRSWLELAGDDFFPVVAFDVKNVDIVHPVHAVIATEVDDFGIDEAASGGDTNAWFISTY
jgi:hypothetical protein|tara:strand:- start:343 stop:531 length:189 start_codon:yes stop_codon:yes gene_type:complete